MDQDKKKTYILTRIDQLIDLMEEVQKLDDSQNAQLFPDNWLEVQDIRDKLVKYNKCSSESLRKMNYYNLELQAIKDSIAKGERMTYPQFIEWRIKEFLESDDEYRYRNAIYWMRENVVKENGRLYSIKEAINYVEIVRDKFDLKKSNTIEDDLDDILAISY